MELIYYSISPHYYTTFPPTGSLILQMCNFLCLRNWVETAEQFNFLEFITIFVYPETCFVFDLCSIFL